MARVSSYKIHRFIYVVIMPAIFVSFCVILPPFFIFRLILKLYRYLTSENLNGKVVLITGASSGIGEKLASEYAKRGAYLVIVARRENHLQKVAEKARAFGSPGVVPICADVSNVKDCKRFVEETINHFGRLDHLVNNAGIASLCSIEDVTNISNVAPVMDVNFWGSVYPTYFAIPHLKKTRGKIVVNSSSSAFLNPPGLSFYGASKAAVLSFYESIRVELAPEISITIATLGFVDSEMTRGKHLSREGTIQVDSRLTNDLIQFPVMSSGDCAKAMVDAACRKERCVTEPRWFKAFFILKNFCPELMEWYYSRVFLFHGKVSGEKASTAPVYTQTSEN